MDGGAGESLIVVLFSAKWAAAGAVMTPMAIMFGLALHRLPPSADTFKALGTQPLMAAVYAVSLPILIVVMILTAPAGIAAVAWALLGVQAAQSVVWIVLTTRVLGLRLVSVAAMLRPAIAAGAGVALGALAVRAILPSDSIGPLIAGTAAGGLLGAAALWTSRGRSGRNCVSWPTRGFGSVPFVAPRVSRTPPATPVEVAPIEVEEAVDVAAERLGGGVTKLSSDEVPEPRTKWDAADPRARPALENGFMIRARRNVRRRVDQASISSRLSRALGGSITGVRSAIVSRTGPNASRIQRALLYVLWVNMSAASAPIWAIPMARARVA